MIFAGRRRRATEPQIRLILELTSQSDIRDVKNLENCPPVERYRDYLKNECLDTIEPPRNSSTV